MSSWLIVGLLSVPSPSAPAIVGGSEYGQEGNLSSDRFCEPFPPPGDVQPPSSTFAVRNISVLQGTGDQTRELDVGIVRSGPGRLRGQAGKQQACERESRGAAPPLD